MVAGRRRRDLIFLKIFQVAGSHRPRQHSTGLSTPMNVSKLTAVDLSIRESGQADRLASSSEKPVFMLFMFT